MNEPLVLGLIIGALFQFGIFYKFRRQVRRVILVGVGNRKEMKAMHVLDRWVIGMVGLGVFFYLIGVVLTSFNWALKGPDYFIFTKGLVLSAMIGVAVLLKVMALSALFNKDVEMLEGSD